MMRAPTPSEPKSNTFPTYQVPQQESAMRGSAPHPVQQANQVARAAWGGRADPPTGPLDVAAPATSPSGTGGAAVALSVITGSSCRPLQDDNSNVKMQSVTDNCLLNSVTVPKIQRNGRHTAAHNNLNNNYNNNIDSDKLDDSSKFGALPLGRDIPNQKSDDLEVLDNNLNALRFHNANHYDAANCYNNDHDKEERHSSLPIDDDLCNMKQNQRTSNEFDSNLTTTKYYAPLRLRGGGESSLSTGTSGWGSPPSNQASNNNANKPNANGQQPPTTQPNNSGWGGQPGQKPSVGGNPGGNMPAAASSAVGGNAPPGNNVAAQNNNNANSNTSTTAQLEQLKNMREAIFSQDGWGGQHVNQETNWDVPSSPEPAIKIEGGGAAGGPPPWKPNVNNGTELWEANLRNGGQPPPQPQPKTPWGHTPSTNIGGTWGEDDDTADTSNVWTGVPNNQPQPQQWGNNVNNGMWGGVGGGNGNGAGGPNIVQGGNGGGGGWGDPRTANPRMAAAGVGGMDNMRDNMRPDMRTAGAGGMDPRQMDPRQMAGAGDMRVDLRGGITGRLNGAGVEFWGQSGPLGGPGGMPPNKMPGMGGPGNGPAWDEPSPPAQRREMPNYDDGTSLWGNPQPGSHWKDLPTGAGGMGGRGAGPNGPPGMAPNQRGGIGPKPDGGVWAGGPGGGGRNGWDEMGGGSVSNPGGWEDPNAGPWPKQKMGGGPGALWDNDLDWGHKPNIRPQLTKEMVWNSKQFKMLVDMGYKKEDVENALRLRDMNIDEALDILSPMRNRNEPNWGGRHDDHFDHSFQGMGGRGGFPNVGGPTNPLSNAFPPNNTPNLLNNMPGNGGQGNNSLINNISPAVMQKMLSQQGGAGGLGGSQAFGGAPSGNGRPLQPQSQPSTQQLRMLVQQIQMAVQAGYLNHQILNQPLAPHTLVLLNQLLQQIKNLQQLNNQQQLAAVSSKGNLSNNALMQFSVAVTKTKQQILNIQNQITAQQAIYVKQQPGGGGSGMGGYDSFKSNPMHESLNSLEGQFGNLGLKEPQINQQQSRLNQWINKDKEDSNEFSRAPGTSSKPTPTSPNMPLGLTQPDGPWSSGRTDTGWPDSTGVPDTSDKDAQWAAPTQPSLTDLVPEFEPGKPWKGNQIKIEDDPSITPGSVVRSPLSIATIKQDNELFGGMNSKSSPPASDPMASLSLSSSTWSFNPPSTSSAFTSPQVKLPNTKVGLDPAVSSSELWAPKSRGPPPGLSKGNSASTLVNGWSSNLGGGAGAPWGQSVSGNANPRNSGNWGGSQSQWLLLRNLTAQIDGSTLRTLCMQHGPLQNFHLHLHQGFALAKYSSSGEAVKAQATLNNCVLGNTSILAENPTDWDAQTLLRSIASQQGGGSGGWQRSASNPTGDTWSTGWPNNPSSMWSSSNLDSNDPARATPSNLNSFLPNDLLGGESM